MGLPPPDPRPLCPLSSTEFVEPPRKTFLGTPLTWTGVFVHSEHFSRTNQQSNVLLITQTSHKFSKLLQCSTSLPVEGLPDVFSLQMSPPAIRRPRAGLDRLGYLCTVGV